MKRVLANEFEAMVEPGATEKGAVGWEIEGGEGMSALPVVGGEGLEEFDIERLEDEPFGEDRCG